MMVFAVCKKTGKGETVKGYLLTNNNLLPSPTYSLKRIETKDLIDDIPSRTLLARTLLNLD